MIPLRELRSIRNLGRGTINELVLKGYSFNKLALFDINNLSGIDSDVSLLECNTVLLKKLQDHGVKTVRDFLLFDEFQLPSGQSKYKYYTIFDQIIESGGFKLENKSLVKLIHESIEASTKSETNKEALISRIRGEITLEEAGKIASLTRERIRQLEKAAYVRIRKNMVKFEEEIRPFLEDRKDPLYLWKLESHVAWLNGMTDFFSSYQHHQFFKMSKKTIKDSCYKVEILQDQFLFFPSNAPDFKTIFKEIFNQPFMPEDEISLYCKLRNRSDITLLLIEEIQKKVNNLSVRQKLYRKVTKYLSEADELKTAQEIYNHCSMELAEVEANQISEAIKMSGAYKFSTRGWGLEENFAKLNKSEAKKMFNAAVEFISAQNKQVSATEILLSFQSSSLSSLVEDKKINDYDVDWVLRKFNDEDTSLVDRKRLKWIYGSEQKEKRITIVDAALDILSKNEGPMELSHLKKEILKKTGRVRNFQLHTNSVNPDLIQVGDGPSTWGIRFRDLAVTEEQENNLLQLIEAELSEGNPVLDGKQVMNMSKEIGISDEISPFQISRCLKRHVYIHPEKSDLFWVKYYRSYPDAFQIIKVDYKANIPSLDLKEYKKIHKSGATYISLNEAKDLFIANKIINQSQFQQWRGANSEKSSSLPQFPDKYWEKDGFSWSEIIAKVKYIYG
ncbi:hypothetical protein OAJ35_02800 [Gammaproteobacteria bacterium]|nr:hypothetical protein [Gammaproteobacteria bacterium]